MTTKKGSRPKDSCPPASSCYRTWIHNKKFLFCLTVSAAVLYNSRQGHLNQVKSREWSDESDLRSRFLAWKDIMAQIEVSRFYHPELKLSAFEDETEELIGPCNMDTVRILGTELEQLAVSLAGRSAVEFGEDSYCRSQLNISEIIGTWSKGKLVGKVEIKFEDGRRMEALMKNGVMFGLVKVFRCVYETCYEADNKTSLAEWGLPDTNSPVHLESLRLFRGGRPLAGSPAWWFPVGGGSLQCLMDADGEPHGSACTFLYSDLVTSLRGVWQHGRMTSGVPAKLTGLTLKEGILMPQAELLDDSRVYSEDISSKTVISRDPLLTDIYEDKTVYVADSMLPGAGEGLFARRDIKKDEIVAFYNGIRMTEQESRVSREYRRSQYRLMGWWDSIVMDIPKQFIATENYTASFGHKANHINKNLANGIYVVCKHPRFGEISSIQAVKNIPAGTEVLVDYGYIEKYMATQNMLDSLVTIAKQSTGNKSGEAFKADMKNTIRFVRKKLEMVRPLIDMMKFLKSS